MEMFELSCLSLSLSLSFSWQWQLVAVAEIGLTLKLKHFKTSQEASESKLSFETVYLRSLDLRY